MIKLRTEYRATRIKPFSGNFKSLLEFPSHFEIETINACNARCPMCTIDEWNKEEKLMDDHLFRKIVQEISENKSNVKRVNLYRDGEPLLDRKLPDRIELCNQLEVPSVSISTNASLLTPELSERILQAGLKMITFSLDSLSKPIYESIRRGLDFEVVLDNIINFLKIRNSGSYNCEVWIRMIRQESNQNEFKSYKKYWDDTGLIDYSIDRVYYHNIFNWGGQLDEFTPVSINTETHLPCVALWSLMPIFAGGDVPMCNVDFNCNHKVGNVRLHSIKEIWQGAAMESLRLKHLGGLKADIEMCGSCNVWEEVVQRDGSPSVSSQYAKLFMPIQ